MGDKYYLETDGYSVGYDGKTVVSGIEIELEKGEILTLIGPNGAGKTTVLKTLIRQLRKITGVAYIAGQDIEQIKKDMLAKKLSVVLTDKLQTELTSVEEIVATGRYPYTGRFGLLRDNDIEIVKNAMKQTDVIELADMDFDKLSDGQRQRVMLARALAQEPEIIILDEPTSFLDIKYKLEFLSTIKKLAKDKKLTVIMSLHEVELAEKISDKIACFRDGIMTRFGTPKEVFSNDYILELYDINTEIIATELKSILEIK